MERNSQRRRSSPVAARSKSGARAPGFGPLLAVFRELPMLPVILVALAALSVTVDGFLSVGNMQNIARQLSVILIAVTAETLVLLIGGIDLSIGAIIGLASVCGAMTMQVTASSLLGLLACLATGAVFGAINGAGIARGGIQPFIMTFGVMLTARALGFLLTGGRSIGRLPRVLLEIGRTSVAGLPLVFVFGLVVALAGSLVLRRTLFGQKIYLTGSNPRAAAFSGIKIDVVKFQIYLISGILGRRGGLCLHDAARLGFADRRRSVTAAGHRSGRAGRDVAERRRGRRPAVHHGRGAGRHSDQEP